MSSGPIATASVKIVPDLTGFQALLQSEVNKAVANVQKQMKPLQASVVAASSAASAGAGARVGAGAGSGARGVNDMTKGANALRGALIGLSHVTPVTVFGLGAAGTAALAAGLAIKSAITATADFEKQLNTLQAVTRISDEQLESVRATAVALGGDVTLAAISASDAAVAMTELAKAGLSIKDTLAAARGVLELAGAAEISAGEAAKFVATELNAFGLAGDQALRVVDLLASASIAAQGEITDFGNAFQQVAAVAAQAGLSVEQTTGALTLLAKAGITSSDAGTSLRTFLLRLIPTTKQAGEFVRALGVELDNSKTEGAQLADVIEQYRAALLLLNPVQRTNVLNQIFGQDAIRAASVLLTDNVYALQRQIDELDNAGVAQELNTAKAKGLSGAWAGLQSNLETTGIKIGSFVDGPLEGLVRGLSDTVTAADKAVTAIKDLGTKIGNTEIPVINIPIKVVFEGDDPFSKAVKQGLKDGLFLGPAILRGLFPADAGALGPAPELFPGGKNELNKDFGIGSLLETATRAQQDEFDRTFGAAARRNKDAKRALQKKIQKLIDEQAGGSADSPNIVAPRNLRNAQLQAQLSDNLQAELKADQAIENHFRRRLVAAKKHPVVYNAILVALVQAHNATQSVLGQIKSENDRAKQERDRNLKDRQQAVEDAIDLQRTRLENAAELTDHTGAAERKLIAFYLRESKDLRLTEAARLSYEAAYNKEIEAQRKGIVERTKAQIDLQNEILNTRLSAALLTPQIDDEKRIYNLQIKALNDDIKRQKALAAKAGERSKIGIEALTQVQKDLQSINGIKQTIKNLSGDTSFSLADLFKQAADQFSTFGSNITARNGVLSGQDERASFGRAILNNRDRGVTLAGQQLTEAQRTNQLLQQLIDKTGRPVSEGGVGGAPALAGKGSKGNLLAIYGTEIAAAYNYGVN